LPKSLLRKIRRGDVEPTPINGNNIGNLLLDRQHNGLPMKDKVNIRSNSNIHLAKQAPCHFQF
jgi:hypothetical protein